MYSVCSERTLANDTWVVLWSYILDRYYVWKSKWHWIELYSGFWILRYLLMYTTCRAKPTFWVQILSLVHWILRYLLMYTTCRAKPTFWLQILSLVHWILLHLTRQSVHREPCRASLTYAQDRLNVPQYVHISPCWLLSSLRLNECWG